ncbi:MAG TPA: COX15/CtaA family protein [Acidimicrobiia bacterium]|nr:COX15/CtaA family protein [Acidimicrobiia bacterium]
MHGTLRLAWVAVGWNVLNIGLGALVRATHSGAGCGRSWPTCQGVALPELSGATAIEYTHRLASGVSLLLVAWLVMVVYRTTGRGSPLRKAATWAGAAALAEALIGAAIVLYEWVGDDASVARVISVPLHLVNTLLLLGSLTLTAWYAGGGGRLQGRRGRRTLILGALALVAIFASGAVTALADTLFPVSGLGDVEVSHFLTRLRVLHPVLATGVVVAALGAARVAGLPPLPLAWRVLWLSVAQVGLGILNVLAGTPLWLQLLHLVVADAIWIAYVWLAAQVLASESTSTAGLSTGLWQTNPLQR